MDQQPEQGLCEYLILCWMPRLGMGAIFWYTYMILFTLLPMPQLLQHIDNNRPQAWTWGKKDTHQWVAAFRKLVDQRQSTEQRDTILSAMLKDVDFIAHAAMRFEYWSTAIMARRRDFFTAFLNELSGRAYQPSALVAEIMLYTVKNHAHDLAVEFIQSKCVTPSQLQDFQLASYAIEHSSQHTGSDVFDAVWRKGGNSVQGVKNINPALMKLMHKKVSDWNSTIVDKLLPKINSASARKYFVGQPIHITDRLEHIIGLHEQMVLSKQMARCTEEQPTAHKVRKM